MDGKSRADAGVAASLFHRAKGYSHDAVKIVADAKTGAEHIVPYTEHYPPDTTACIFWLKNRRKNDWRDGHDVDVKQEVKISIDRPERVTRDDWLRYREKELGALGAPARIRPTPRHASSG